MKKRNLITVIYLSLWLIPFVVFFKDFFEFSTISNIFNFKTFRILKNTLIQSFLSTIMSFVIALVPAYFISIKKNILSNIIESSLFIPFFFPPISTIVSFSIILNIPFIKQLNISYTLTAIVIAHSFYNSPIFVKYIGEALRKIPINIKEHSQLDGFPKTYLFFKIELPIIMPSILRAFFLVFTYSFTSFVIVLTLGNIRYSTFEVAIVKTLLSSLDFSKALGFAVIQLVFLSMINYFTTNIEEYQLEEQEPQNSSTNLWVWLASISYIFFEFSIIIIGLTASFYDFFNNKFNLYPLVKIFTNSFNKKYPVLISMRNSVIIGIFVSTATVLIVYIILRYKSRFTNFVVLSSMGISSVFLAMTLLYLNILYRINFPILVIAGYLLIAIPIAYSFMYQHITGFDKSIIEAANLDGANSFHTFINIEFPLLRPILLSTFLQIFAIIYGEFTIVYTMQMNDYFPLASVVNYQISSQKLFPESAAFSTINVIIIFALFWLSKKIKHIKFSS